MKVFFQRVPVPTLMDGWISSKKLQMRELKLTLCFNFQTVFSIFKSKGQKSLNLCRVHCSVRIVM